MKFPSEVRVLRRALTNAALIGASVGVAFGATAIIAGLTRPAPEPVRVARLVQSAEPGTVRIALQYPASAISASHVKDVNGQASRRDLKLRASFSTDDIAGPMRRGGAPQASRDLDCLTQAVYFEARGEAPAGQAAVAQVVMNRVHHPAFPKTVCGVVYQGAGGRGCQFSFACDGEAEVHRESAAWTRARAVAGRALSGFVMGEVGQATHFHTTGVSPAWGPRLMRTAQVGLHVFYRFGRSGGPAIVRAAEASDVRVAQAPDAQPSLRLASVMMTPEPDTAVLTSLPTPAPSAKAAPAAVERPVDVTDADPKPAKTAPTTNS